MSKLDVLTYIPYENWNPSTVYMSGAPLIYGAGRIMYTAYTKPDGAIAGKVALALVKNAAGRPVNYYLSTNNTFRAARVYDQSTAFKSDTEFICNKVVSGYNCWYGDGVYTNNFPADVEWEAYDTLEDAVIDFLQVDKNVWNIQYIPINCELDGVVTANENETIEVSLTAPNHGIFVSASVYTSESSLEYTLERDKITFVTPRFT